VDDHQEIIDNLSPEDALTILRQLAARDEKLAGEIAALARNHLSKVDMDKVARTLRHQLELLEPEDVWERAGMTRYGYVDDSEAAFELLQELLEPHLDEVRRRQKAGLYLEAEQICMGLMLAFYEFEYEWTSEFKDWVVDLSLEYACDIARLWRKGSGGRDDSEMQAFIEAALAQWAPVLVPLVRGEDA
jgi:hypothetical protein